MKKTISLLSYFLIVALFFACSFSPEAKDVSSVATGEEVNKAFDTTGWYLAWSEEFDGTSVDTSRWSFDIGNGVGGWGNQELQYYSKRMQGLVEAISTLM
jgi:beta-glucanase (GH16 family)